MWIRPNTPPRFPHRAKIRGTRKRIRGHGVMVATMVLGAVTLVKVFGLRNLDNAAGKL